MRNLVCQFCYCTGKILDSIISTFGDSNDIVLQYVLQCAFEVLWISVVECFAFNTCKVLLSLFQSVTTNPCFAFEWICHLFSRFHTYSKCVDFAESCRAQFTSFYSKHPSQSVNQDFMLPDCANKLINRQAGGKLFTSALYIR